MPATFGLGGRRPVAVLVVLCAAAALEAVVVRPTSAQARNAGQPLPGLSSARTIPADRAVVSGRVVEAVSGRPVPDANVRAQGAAGTVTATSNGDGDFELSVSPGRYTVAARAAGFVESFFGQDAARPGDFGAQVLATGGRQTRGIDIKVQAASVVSGRILDDKDRGLPGIEVELVRAAPILGTTRGGGVSFALTDEDGTYLLRDVPPGDYVVRAYKGRATAPVNTTTVPNGEPRRDYVPTFYPGVKDRPEALPLRIFAGQELLGLDFALATSPHFAVRGTLVDPGATSFANLVVRLNFIGATGRGTLEATADEKGGFQFTTVPAGDYLLSVGEPQRSAAPPVPGGGAALSVWMSASRPLLVDEDVELELRAVAPARVRGRILKDPSSAAALDVSRVGVGFVQMAEDGGQRTGMGLRALGGVLAEVPQPIGQTYLEIDAPDGWMVKSITLNGADASDGPIDLQSARYEIEVMLTDRVSRVFGTVVNRRGEPLPNHTVLIFTADASRWFPLSRFIQQGRTDNAGRFSIDRVPPGTYHAVAVPALPPIAPSESARRAVLQALQPSADTIRVGEGQQVTLSLRASALPLDLQLVAGGP